MVGTDGLERAAAWTWRERARACGTEDLEEEGGSGVGGGGREHTSGVADAVVVEVAGAVSRRGGAVTVVREEAARDLGKFGN